MELSRGGSELVVRIPIRLVLEGWMGKKGLTMYVGLTPRQKQVVAAMRRGKVNKEIAVELGVSLRTVKFHTQQALKVLGMKRQDLVRFYGITKSD